MISVMAGDLTGSLKIPPRISRCPRLSLMAGWGRWAAATHPLWVRHPPATIQPLRILFVIDGNKVSLWPSVFGA